MSEKKKAVMNWSGGKDSAHALLRALHSNEYDIVALLTTTNKKTELSTMHNIPVKLLQAQSESIGIPLDIVGLKPTGDMDDYTEAMNKVAQKYQAQGITHFIYGDIFLTDIRKYREQQLGPFGISVVEPLWGPSSKEVIEEYLETGLQTVIVTTENKGLGMEAIGKIINKDFIESLPKECDPNGENGEYHTFCFDGPLFKFPIAYELGAPIQKSYDIRLDNGTLESFTYCFANVQVPSKA